MKPSYTFTLICLLSTILLSAACSKEESNIKVEDFLRPGYEPNSVKANLPSPPPSSAFVIQEKNNDGTLRVRGMIHNQEKYLDQDQDVVIKGIVTLISPSCDPKKAKETGERCIKPHFFIKDDVDAMKALQVVGYPSDFMSRAKVKEGESHIIRGRYLKSSHGFVNSGDGLIALTSIDETEVRPSKK